MDIGAAITKYPKQTKNPTYREILANYTQDIGSPPAVVRTYSGNAPANTFSRHWQYRDAQQHAGIHSIHHSFKASPLAVTSGNHDRAITEAVRRVTKPTRLTFWHEPEDNVRKNRFTERQWVDATLHIMRLVRHTGNTLVTVGPVLMRWTLHPASNLRVDDYRYGSNGDDMFTRADFIGWDAYNTGSFRKGWTSPEETFGAVRDFHGRNSALPPPAIAETGAAPDRGNLERRGVWLRDAVDLCRTFGAVEFCVFDSNVGRYGSFLRIRRDRMGRWVQDRETVKAWSNVVEDC